MAYWQDMTVGDLCNTISETYSRNDDMVVLVNTSDVLEGKILNHQKVENRNLKGQFKKTFKKNDILYSEIRPANKRYAYIDFNDTEHYIASTKLMILRTRPEVILPRYLFAFLTSKHVLAELQHLAETRSGTFPQITFASELAPIPITVPDLQTQEKIIGLLMSIEEKININKKINENLVQQMTTIYINMRNSSKWSKKKLDDILAFYDHMRKPLSSRQRDGMQRIYPYYGATTVVDYVEEYIFDGTYILISEDGANVVDKQGHPLIQYTYGKFWVNNHAHIVKGNNDFSEALLFIILKTLNMQSIVTGAAQPKINQANLRNYDTELPGPEEARQLSSALNPFLAQIIANDKENLSLAELRDALLPRLMSGELDVSGLEL